MSSKAFFVTAAKAVPVANDVSPDSPYRASVHLIAPGNSVPAGTNPAADMLLFVEQGTIELMIGGASGYLSAGEFARVPQGTVFAWRNAGGKTARLLSLAVTWAERAPVTRILAETAAA